MNFSEQWLQWWKQINSHPEAMFSIDVQTLWNAQYAIIKDLPPPIRMLIENDLAFAISRARQLVLRASWHRLLQDQSQNFGKGDAEWHALQSTPFFQQLLPDLQSDIKWYIEPSAFVLYPVVITQGGDEYGGIQAVWVRKKSPSSDSVQIEDGDPTTIVRNILEQTLDGRAFISISGILAGVPYVRRKQDSAPVGLVPIKFPSIFNNHEGTSLALPTYLAARALMYDYKCFVNEEGGSNENPYDAFATIIASGIWNDGEKGGWGAQTEGVICKQYAIQVLRWWRKQACLPYVHSVMLHVGENDAQPTNYDTEELLQYANCNFESLQKLNEKLNNDVLNTLAQDHERPNWWHYKGTLNNSFIPIYVATSMIAGALKNQPFDVASSAQKLLNTLLEEIDKSRVSTIYETHEAAILLNDYCKRFQDILSQYPRFIEDILDVDQAEQLKVLFREQHQENFWLDISCTLPTWFKDFNSLKRPLQERLSMASFSYRTYHFVWRREGVGFARVRLGQPVVWGRNLVLTETDQKKNHAINSWNSLEEHLALELKSDENLPSFAEEHSLEYWQKTLVKETKLYSILNGTPPTEVVIITGPGGAGKSTLTLAWFKKNYRTFNHVDGWRLGHMTYELGKQYLEHFPDQTPTVIDGIEHIIGTYHTTAPVLMEFIKKQRNNVPLIITSRNLEIAKQLLNLTEENVQHIEIDDKCFVDSARPAGFQFEDKLAHARSILKGLARGQSRAVMGTALLDLGEPDLLARILSLPIGFFRWLHYEPSATPDLLLHDGVQIRDSARESLRILMWNEAPQQSESWILFTLPYLHNRLMSIGNSTSHTTSGFNEEWMRGELLSRGIALLIELAKQISEKQVQSTLGDILVHLHDLTDAYQSDTRNKRDMTAAFTKKFETLKTGMSRSTVGAPSIVPEYLSVICDHMNASQLRRAPIKRLVQDYETASKINNETERQQKLGEIDSRRDCLLTDIPKPPPQKVIERIAWCLEIAAHIRAIDAAHNYLKSSPNYKDYVITIINFLATVAEGLLTNNSSTTGSSTTSKRAVSEYEACGILAVALIQLRNNRDQAYDTIGPLVKIAKKCLDRAGNPTRLSYALVTIGTNQRVLLDLDNAQKNFIKADNIGGLIGKTIVDQSSLEVIREIEAKEPSRTVEERLFEMLVAAREITRLQQEKLIQKFRGSHQLVGRDLADNLLRWNYSSGWSQLLLPNNEDLQFGFVKVLNQIVLLNTFTELSKEDTYLFTPPFASRFGNAAIGLAEGVEALLYPTLQCVLLLQSSADPNIRRAFKNMLRALRVATKFAVSTLIHGIGCFIHQYEETKHYEENISISMKNIGSLMAWEARLLHLESQLPDAPNVCIQQMQMRVHASRLLHGASFVWSTKVKPSVLLWVRQHLTNGFENNGDELNAFIEHWKQEIKGEDTCSLIGCDERLNMQERALQGLQDLKLRLEWVLGQSRSHSPFPLPQEDEKVILPATIDTRLQSWLVSELCVLPDSLRLDSTVYNYALNEINWRPLRTPPKYLLKTFQEKRELNSFFRCPEAQQFTLLNWTPKCPRPYLQGLIARLSLSPVAIDLSSVHGPQNVS